MNRDPAVLLDKVTEAVADGDGPVLSVYCAEVTSLGVTSAVHDAVVCGDVAHGQVQVSTVGAMAGAGFDLTRHTADGEPECHHHVHFGNDLTTARAELFIACFDEPIPNPAGAKRRR